MTRIGAQFEYPPDIVLVDPFSDDDADLYRHHRHLTRNLASQIKIPMELPRTFDSETLINI